jgi:hypothetical protein
MTTFESAHEAAALRRCGRLRTATCGTATVFTLTNLMPGWELVDSVTSALFGLPLLAVISFGALLSSGVLACLYISNLLVLQKLAQRRLGRWQRHAELIPRTYLYLRSFDESKSSVLDHLRRIFDSRVLNTSSFCRTAYKMHDPEEEIAQAVAGTGLLIAIGDKTRSYGAAKLHTNDERWQDEFARLADESELIFVSPALTHGSKWELEKLFENKEYLRKTVFVMPRNWYSDEWDDLKAAFHDLFAFELPEYTTKGAYFFADPRGQMPRRIEPEDFIRSLKGQPTRQLVVGDAAPSPEL